MRTRLTRLLLFTVGLLLIVALGGYLFRNPILARLGVRIPTGNPAVIQPDLPDGLTSTIFAEGLNGPRFMTVGPDGTLFVAERGLNRIVALPDRNADGRADESITIAEGLDRPSSLVFRPGTSQLYVGETSRVSRFTLDGLRVVEQNVVIPDLPTTRVHFSTTVLFDQQDGLYVSVGSSCNVCIEGDPRLATVWRYDADGTNGRLFTAGLRNAVGLALNPTNGDVWATNNGRDLLGNDIPPEAIYVLQDGADAGWPRCHSGDIPDPEFGTSPDACEGVLAPAVEIQAHSAPLGLTFYNHTLMPEVQGSLFIASHGSWNRYPPTGYKVIRVPIENGQVAGEPEDFATGWLQPNGDSVGRPTDVAVATDGALLISDDKGGLIYRIAPD
jgi:glucose/arabinose dehydrogenase